MSSVNVPRRNLGAEAEPWGRSVDERLLRQQGAVDLLQKDVKNSFKGINASVSGVNKAISAISEQQTALDQQQTVLEQQQQELAETVVRLPNHQIRAATYDMTTGADIGLTSTQLISLSINIPSDHNYVAWFVSYSGRLRTTNAIGYVYVYTQLLVDSESMAGWSQANSFYERTYSTVGETYQWGSYAAPGSSARVVISANRDDMVGPLTTAIVSAQFSVFTYKR